LLIGVLADTHGSTDKVCRQLRQWKLDILLFAGDFYPDGEKIARALKVKFHGVSGNCDGSSPVRAEEIIAIQGQKILLTHGHQLGVKQGLNRLYYRACELGVDAVVYGHTHMPHMEKSGDIWLINPGSPTRPRLGNQGSYGIIEVTEEGLTPRIVPLGE